jgi:hypothetical protein
LLQAIAFLINPANDFILASFDDHFRSSSILNDLFGCMVFDSSLQAFNCIFRFSGHLIDQQILLRMWSQSQSATFRLILSRYEGEQLAQFLELIGETDPAVCSVLFPVIHPNLKGKPEVYAAVMRFIVEKLDQKLLWKNFVGLVPDLRRFMFSFALDHLGDHPNYSALCLQFVQRDRTLVDQNLGVIALIKF